METATKERPIALKAPKVRAILNGATQLRVVCKHEPGVARLPDRRLRGPIGSAAHAAHGLWSFDDQSYWLETFAPYKPGERVWVKERWAFGTGDGVRMGLNIQVETEPWCYAVPEAHIVAAVELVGKVGHAKWKPARSMPRWASRLTLEITGVRVERLQDISEADVFAEGVQIPVSKDGHLVVQLTGGPKPADYVPDGFFKRPWGSGDGEVLTRAHYAALWDQINGKGSWAANPFVWVVEFRRVES